MYKKTLQSVKNPLKTEVDSVNARKPHFIFSAENPRYPVKYNLDSLGVQDLLAKKGYRFDVIQGHYGSPESSILVHNPNKHAVRYLQNLAQGLGQESSIYSDGYNHEMHFHGGEHTGQHLKGQGTNFHKKPPQDFFSTLKDGTTFTHSFDTENFHEADTSKLKPEGYVKKSEDNLTLVHYSPNQGLKSISPNHQGSRIKDSSSKHGRPEHPVAFFYRHDSPTEDLVTQGSNSKYHVQAQEAKLYDLGLDKDKVSQHLKSSGQTLNPGIVTRDELHGELKKRGFHGFYNSQHEREDMRGVVGLYHDTPVAREESLSNIQKAIQSPSKHIGLDRLKQIQSDNHIGAGGKEYSEHEVGHAINERQTAVANKMVAGAGKQEKLRAQNEENEAKGVGGVLPTDFPWMNKPKAAASKKGSDKIRQVADKYAATKGLKLQHNMPAVKVDPTRAKRIADAYHQANHEPQAQHVQQAYKSLIDETNEQFKHILDSGLKISKIKPGQDNPYKSSKDLFHDLHNNNHVWYFPTDQGFGSGQVDTSHPMLQPTEHTHEGQPMLANDVFRIVHDYFGHAKEGHGFGAEGEENAWKNHLQMYSPMAQKALTAETRGQNSWVNFGPHAEHNKANPSQTKYADQKATILPDWASDSEHHSVYKQLGGLKKREVIMMKGAMGKLAPFDPGKHVTSEQHKAIENWTKEGDDQDAREKVPEIHANAKIRALHKLGGKTQVRKHPKTGERMFLLHRGMAESEFQTNHINGVANYPPNSFTSWTPDYKTAKGFASDHHETGSEPRIVSAWIPESHIHNVPNATLVPASGKQFRNEHEVIVNHTGKFPHAHPNLIETIKDPRKDLNQKINMKGVAEKAQEITDVKRNRDFKKQLKRQDNAEVYRMGKFGKREAIMTPTLQKGDVSNKIKSGIAGLAIAAGTLAPLDTAKQNKPQQPAPQVAAPAPPTKKDHILKGIKFIESSGGKNTDHAEMKSGMFKGDKAYGSYGLMPVVIRETIKRHPSLMQLHSAALGMSGKDIHTYMDQNPKLEDIIASKHYDLITRALGENPMKIGYAWLNGIQGTKNAIKANKALKDHHYVQKLMGQLHPPVKKPLGPNTKK